MLKKLPLLAAIVLAVSTLVACGGDSGPQTELKVELSDFEFSPNDWNAVAGQPIDIELTNNGSVEHEWVILQKGVTIDSEADLPDDEETFLANFVEWETEVGEGETKNDTFPALEAGEYQIICGIEGHFDAGMEGTLTVSSE